MQKARLTVLESTGPLLWDFLPRRRARGHAAPTVSRSTVSLSWTRRACKRPGR